MTKTLNHPLNQPSPTSLIQCIASGRNCEQVHAIGLESYLPTRKRCWCREICRNENLKSAVIGWSAPYFFKESPTLGMTEFLADGPDWYL